MAHTEASEYSDWYGGAYSGCQICHAAKETPYTALNNGQMAAARDQMHEAAFMGTVAMGTGAFAGLVGGHFTIATACGDGDCTNEAVSISDRIIATQPIREGTQVPKSFILSNANGEFWVHGNATKHMAELLSRGPATQTSAAHQILLESFDDAVLLATEKGITFNRMLSDNGWELKFVQSINDLYPVINHALYRPQ